MLKLSRRSIGALCTLTLLLSADGCRRHRKTTSAPNTTSYSDAIEPLTETTHLPFLRWPDITDYQPLVKTFYDDRNDEIAWTRDGNPTPAAMGFMTAFAQAELHGLHPDDYDARKWEDRMRALTGRRDKDVVQFDIAMTVNVMRFISDLRVGRVNPQHFNFDINVADKKYNLAEFVSDNAVDATDVPALIKKVEPNSELYRRTEQALARYLDLERKQVQEDADPLPEYERALNVGDTFDDATALTQRLQLEGDLDGGDPDGDLDGDASRNTQAGADRGDDDAKQPAKTRSGKPAPKVYTKRLSEAVKKYQSRHGFTEDGKLTSQTIASLNVPMSERVQQLDNTLERWRWLPDKYVNPRLMVNLPEFVLRGYTPDNTLDFTMRVVVGQVMGEHQTPVFAHMMRYLVFRPYWTVPISITRKELVPHMQANKGYLASKNFEVVTAKGQPYPNYTVQQVAQGSVMVREKPGPKNSLGLVKFMFPNQYDIYLHSTPAPQLFSRTRRDFSHGCIRVQKPEDLAVWVLDGQKDKDGEEWDLDKVHDAMYDGDDNHQVNLKTPLPIVIFYMTAEVEEDGSVHFFDDIYHYDEQMEKVLEKGPPYPIKPDPIAPKPKPGDTV
ncbi:MAG: L,D-transpeptidase family protein [Edaphobacter sp.]|uniref:L,D-transpeptidase family protein n=1 Tax=Edaphobacter sp. TaxID=1934404 RepID=UPI002384FB52|nr:L,D-transpeptidase family protein [Edaphobacter sp.]MDE1176829.1 L,D-transpeptidase family protein [Edaphobacter sp.]